MKIVKRLFLFMIVSLFAVTLIGCGDKESQGDTGTKTKQTVE